MSYMPLIALFLGYLLGSIPFGLLLTRAAGLGDVRSIGSGNIGATNVLRTGNKGLAASTLLLDALKGTGAVLIASRYGQEAAMLAGFGAFVGHIFPVWLGFKGGKGVATYIGILFGLTWQAGLLFVVIWILVALALRYSSLSALTACLVTPFTLWLMGRSAITFFTHRANIARLIAGTETRIGAKG